MLALAAATGVTQAKFIFSCVTESPLGSALGKHLYSQFQESAVVDTFWLDKAMLLSFLVQVVIYTNIDALVYLCDVWGSKRGGKTSYLQGRVGFTRDNKQNPFTLKSTFKLMTPTVS